MQKTRKINVLNWSSAKQLVKRANQELFDIINALNPSDNLKLIHASYLFGDLIVDNGITSLPNKNGALTTIENSDLPDDLKYQLSYSPIPLILTLKNDNEVFLDTGRRAIPLNLFHQGSMLGVFETLSYIFKQEAHPKWCVSAGARSIILLPKIADNVGLDRMRVRYDLPANLYPAELRSQWEFFKKIAQSNNFEQTWENEVLFFTKEWLGNTGIKWQKFNDYIYRQGWIQTSTVPIGKLENSLLWEKFSEAISMRNLKPRPYLADQLRYILAISDCKAPAFQPVYSQTFAPLDGIKEAIIDVYELRHYFPTIMCINPLHDSKKNMVYYSLSYPTLLEGTTIDRSTSTIMLDLRKLKLLIDTIQTHGRTNYDELLQRIEYFHTENDKFNEIKASIVIPDMDNHFLKDLEQFPKRKFCSTSLFLRGCISIQVN